MNANERTQLLRIVGFTFLGALALGLIRFLFDPMPAIAHPSVRSVPSPNALDSFKEAASELVGLEELRSSRRRRFDWGVANRGRDWSGWFARNEAAIEKLSEGLRHEFGLPPEAFAEGTYASEFSALYPLRHVFRAKVEHALFERDSEALLGAFEAALVFRERIGTCGGPFGRSAANAPVWQVLRYAWRAAETLDPDTARRAARSLQGFASRGPSFAEILEAKRELDLLRLATYLESDAWKLRLAKAVLRRMRAEGLPTAISALMDSRLNVVGSYKMAMQALIERAKRPFAKRGEMPPLPESELAAAFVGDYLDLAWFQELKIATQLYEIATTLALRAYRFDFGEYPPSLNALVPTYLASVPPDPFSEGGALRYRRESEGFSLYSVGPDGLDSGGVPVVETFTRSDGEHVRSGYVRIGSKGDIVAGLNW